MRRTSTLLVALALFATACSDDPAPADEASSTTAATPTVDDTTTTAPAATTTVVPPPTIDDPDGSIRAAAVAGVAAGLVPGDGPNMTAEQQTCAADGFVDAVGAARAVELGFAAGDEGDPFADGALDDADERSFIDVYFDCVNVGTIIEQLALADLTLDAGTVTCMHDAAAANQTMRDELQASMFGGEPPSAEASDQAMASVVTGCLSPEQIAQLSP